MNWRCAGLRETARPSNDGELLRIANFDLLESGGRYQVSVGRSGTEGTEGDAVSARGGVRHRDRRTRVVHVGRMCDRVEPKRQQQADECDSQPLWGSSGQLKHRHGARCVKPTVGAG